MSTIRTGSVIVMLAWVVACGTPALERLAHARRLSTELHQQFSAVTTPGDAAAVPLSAVEQTAAALHPLLDGLGFIEESHRLESFQRRFAEYRVLDGEIRDLYRRGASPSRDHALALVLEQKGALAARCEDDLRALADALNRRDVSATR